jgi:hypothetical protein
MAFTVLVEGPLGNRLAVTPGDPRDRRRAPDPYERLSLASAPSSPPPHAPGAR